MEYLPMIHNAEKFAWLSIGLHKLGTEGNSPLTASVHEG